MLAGSLRRLGTSELGTAEAIAAALALLVAVGFGATLAMLTAWAGCILGRPGRWSELSILLEEEGELWVDNILQGISWALK